MANFLLLMLDIWLLGGIALFLHFHSPRLGFAPLLLFIGAITVFVQIRWSIYIEPVDDLLLFITSNALVPVILMAVLIIYVSNGSVPARLTIYGIAGITLLILAWMGIARLHLELPQGGTFSGLEPDELLPTPHLRLTAGSLIAFMADMFVIAVFYQGIKNNIPQLPESVTVGLALIASLWTDAIVFHMIVDLGTPEFSSLLSSDIVGKTLSALILWIPLAVYIVKIAPTLPDHVGGADRPTFDLLSGSFSEIKLALVRTQAALDESESQRREESAYRQQIIDHISEGLWLAEPHTHFAFYVNSAYEAIWGQPAQAIYGNATFFINSLHPEDREQVQAGLGRQTEGSYESEYRIVRPNGETRWIRDRVFPIRDETGAIFRLVGIAEDITERKQGEKERLELKMERERVKLLRDFISHASHDLKSPLTAINLKATHAAMTNDPVKRQVHLKAIEGIVTRMTGIIDDLLMLARLENVDEMTIQQVDLGKVLNECTESLQALADEKQLELRVQVPAQAIPLRVDLHDLGRAFGNLIENAINYTPAGGQVGVICEIQEHEVTICISDTGIGIPDDAKPFIFNRFYRATNARSTQVRGSGLGLAIVQKVIELHGGKIEMISSVGAGTAFTITLPRVLESITV